MLGLAQSLTFLHRNLKPWNACPKDKFIVMKASLQCAGGLAEGVAHMHIDRWTDGWVEFLAR